MSRDESYVLDIVKYAREVLEFSGGIDKEAFLKDQKTQAAVERALEVMGEAAKQVGEAELRQAANAVASVELPPDRDPSNASCRSGGGWL